MLSLWQDGVVHPERDELVENLEVDVVIVGAGYTGLWTAYYLTEIEPTLSIAIIESKQVGFGASGRNGGWCSAQLPWSPEELEIEHGREAMDFIQREMFTTVDEVCRVARIEDIDCDFAKGGTLTSASSPAHVDRLRKEVASWHRAGFDNSDMCWLDANELRHTINLATTYGGVFSPHCAALHPFKLVLGLARVLERRGIQIFENSRATVIEAHQVRTPKGSVTARHIVRATEAYTSQLPGHRRTVVPLYSLMVATEPLPENVWNDLGWSQRTTFADGRNMVTYAQRTADDRIAFGGRGAPYHFGSAIDHRFDEHRRIHNKLEATVRELFPQIGDSCFTHRWGGPLASPRDWHAYATYDPATGVATGGGYVGDGVALSNLVGRTLSHLIVGTDHQLTRSLLVNHMSGQWEREPLRWLGINGLLALTELADRHERRTGQASRGILKFRDRLMG
ncbi:MAG: NAD(P)/FAD-dependent oxidoreductase [Ilumatobacteraceae bacterium]